MPPDLVLFYGYKRAFSEFSNWHTSFFDLDGKTWPTVEHYFMAMKTTDPDHQERIRKAPGPSEAKQWGSRKGFITLRDGWDKMKFDVMLKANLAKFQQNPGLAAILLSTGDKVIHEDCPDPWWGGGPNYPKGRDWLGQVLMQVRDELRT